MFLNFKWKFLLSVLTFSISLSLYASPKLFNPIDNNLSIQDSSLLNTLMESNDNIEVVDLSDEISFNKLSSFIFDIKDKTQEKEIKNISFETKKNGVQIWQGESENGEDTATFAINNGKVNGGIRLKDGSFYEVYPINKKLHALVKIDIPNFHEDKHDDVWDDIAKNHQHEFNEELSNKNNYYSTDEVATIKVMYVYTNQTRPFFGNNPIGYASYLNKELNISHENSQTLTKFELAGVVDAKIDETSMSSMLSQMGNTSTTLGKLLAGKRQEFRADLVVLISESAEYCGLAQGWGINSVVARGCAVSVRTLAHETGHNFGLKHNEDEATWPAYANGYKVPGKFSTIMSKGCTPACPRINFFSSPLKHHNGQPMGTTASNDAVRFINERRFIVANNFPDWEKVYPLNAGELPPRQFFEITLTDLAKNEKLVLDKTISHNGQYSWPYEVAVAVNDFFPQNLVTAGELIEGKISPVSGSSYRNTIWLHLDKKDAYRLEVNRKTYAIYNGVNWSNTNNISGGNGLPAHSTATAIVKSKSTGQIVEQFTFINENSDLDSSGWPYKLAEVINNKKSNYLRAGELQSNGDVTIIEGSSDRNKLWLPLDKKNDLTVTVELFRATKNTSNSQSLAFWPRTFSVNFEPDPGSSFNSQCLIVEGEVKYSTRPDLYVPTKILNWGNTDLTYSSTGSYAWVLTIKNNCGPLSGNIVTQFSRPNGSAPKQYHHIKFYSTAKTSNSQSLAFWPRTFSVNFEPDVGSSFNSQCLIIEGVVKFSTRPNLYAPTKISKFGNTALTYSSTGSYAWDLIITNSCSPVSGNIVTQFSRPNGSAPKQYHHIKLVESTKMVNVSSQH